MEANPDEHNGASSLYPFPEGWYFVASRETIEKNKLIRKTWLGERIVAWCDGDGDICVAEAVCPHLGSDLGPEAGGRVRDGRLVCPSREIEGLIFAWHGIDGRGPQWVLPEPPGGAGDWGGMETWSVRFRGHPQETTENSVDLGHLRYLHGYDAVSGVGPVEVDGAWLRSRFDFRRTQTVAGIKCFTWDVSAVTHVHGLGYSLVEVREHSIGMDIRLWVLATPIDGENVELTLVSQVRLLRKPKRPVAGMRFLPVGLRTRIMNRIVIAAQGRDVMQDVVIWSRKRYRPRPFLCRSDGEIGIYRRYCEQFYPDGRVCARQAAERPPAE